MKKCLKRIISVLLVAVLALSFAVAASAEWSNSDNWNIADIDGVYISKPKKYIPLDMGNVITGAKYFEAFSSDDSVVKINSSNEAYAVAEGVALITIDQYDKNHNYLGSECNIAVVDPRPCTGKITKSYAYDVKVNYKSNAVMEEPDVYYEGDVQYWDYYLPLSGDIYVSPSGEIDTSFTGSGTVACISIASNGSASIALCNVTVKYSFFQWIINILLLGFLWY